MISIEERLSHVKLQIARAEQLYNRAHDSVQLLAVSKTREAEEILTAYKLGQTRFGESYLQEALQKIGQLADYSIQWHYIGRIQSNKTRSIAENFDWVHSVDKPKQLRRLNSQRPDSLPPINVCLQIKLDEEENKGGLSHDEAADLVEEAEQLPHIRLCGLMTLPAPCNDLVGQRCPFRQLRELRDRLATEKLPLSTLSMGMSGDIEAAIAEGATIVRVGTGIFGPRNYRT
ncbi:MAG: YggS family pyridoxal phosphate-dependent enzyme [Gammaproteobacteria bacterium]|nr:YggS family pyridoxal phosphate-dependent enzyme [Gammaproteobacteria bacterium]